MARNPTNDDEPRMVRSHHPKDKGGPERSSGRGIPKGRRDDPLVLEGRGRADSVSHDPDVNTRKLMRRVFLAESSEAVPKAM